MELDQLHSQMILELNGNIDDKGFHQMKTAVTGRHGLQPRDVESAKSPLDLFDRLKM